MNEHERWIHRLSEVVDGSLGPAERRAAEAHLAACAECRGILEELRGVVERARSLGDVPPGRDLWPGIEARLAPSEAEVLPLPTASAAEDVGARAPERRGLFLSVPQLAAAALLLVVASSLATWTARPAPTEAPVGQADPGAAVRPAARAPEAPPELAGELEELSRVVEEAGARLDPDTRRIIEKNLAVIEQAIEESRRALAQDPSNPYLREHLGRAWERKLSYLQEAAGIVEWASS